jgi:hypothetical protein
MSQANRKKSPNADLIAVVRHRRDQILGFYEQVADKRRVILLDFQRMKLHSYPYEQYKATLRPDSRRMLDEEHEKAISKKKVLVLVWDNATRRLVTTTLRHD